MRRVPQTTTTKATNTATVGVISEQTKSIAKDNVKHIRSTSETFLETVKRAMSDVSPGWETAGTWGMKQAFQEAKQQLYPIYVNEDGIKESTFDNYAHISLKAVTYKVTWRTAADVNRTDLSAAKDIVVTANREATPERMERAVRQVMATKQEVKAKNAKNIFDEEVQAQPDNAKKAGTKLLYAPDLSTYPNTEAKTAFDAAMDFVLDYLSADDANSVFSQPPFSDAIDIITETIATQRTIIRNNYKKRKNVS